MGVLIKMNLQFYIEKLKNSDIFKKFMKENPDAFLCSGFFIVDKQGNDNKQHFDFYLPKDKKIYSFQLENMQLVPLEDFGKVPEKISFEHDIDFDKVGEMIEKKMASEGIKSKIQKMLFSLQNKDDKDFLIGTVFISALGMLKINIDLKTMEIIDFEKKSFFDIMKISKKKNK